MKRFYKAATVVAGEVDFAILLDGRPVKTPAKSPLAVPFEPLAEAIAAEWNAQGEEIDPASMPMTGLANAVIDRVAAQRETFIADIARFGETDLICYRAEGPQELIQRQEDAWDALIVWAREVLGAPLIPVEGIMAKDQPEKGLAAICKAVAAHSDYQLVVLSKLTSLSGSVVMALALSRGAFAAEELWQASLVDELWQEERWGADEWAEKHRTDREHDFLAAARFLAMV